MWETQKQTLQHTHRAYVGAGMWPQATLVRGKWGLHHLPLCYLAIWIYSRTWSLSSSPKSLVFCQSQHCGSSSKRMAHNCNFTQVQPSLKWKNFFYTDCWKKELWLMRVWTMELIMMVTQFVIFQDTAVTSPEKALKYFALKPLAIRLEWVFNIFTAFLWSNWSEKLLSIFFCHLTGKLSVE